MSENETTEGKSTCPVIVIHGGAAAFKLVEVDKIAKSAVDEGVVNAAKVGYYALKRGQSASDAVVAAVTHLEDNPVFNCGYGSVLTSGNTIEMDACVMDGKTLRTGAVACITNFKNPVQVARAVMDKTPHTMFCGQAASELAKTFGFESVTTDSLTTTKAKNRLQIKVPTTDSADNKIMNEFPRDPDEHDTVGAVALDYHGNVAFATSTGGISGKMCGRVGDSAIVGCGGYADNCSGAVSTTGDGEAFVKLCTAKHVAMLMDQGKSPQEASDVSITSIKTRLGASGGCVAVDTKGRVGIQFNTKGMAWAVIKDDTVKFGLYKGEEYTQSLVDLL